jgi:RNA polymerase-binding transcription factor DksA
VESSEIQVRLEDERAAVLASIDAISADFDAIVSSSTDANSDDEHDPEGATAAFERAQLASLLDDARVTLAAIETALAKLRDGHYGECERCGDAISEERLSALPSTRVCFSCASVA